MIVAWWNFSIKAHDCAVNVVGYGFGEDLVARWSEMNTIPSQFEGPDV